MPLIPDFFYSIFWFVFVAFAAGYAVYIYMKSYVKSNQKEYKSLESKHKKTTDALEALKKETNLEIRARDRKLEIVDEKYLALQDEYQNAQKAFKAQLEEKNKLIQELQGAQETEENSNSADSNA